MFAAAANRARRRAGAARRAAPMPTRPSKVVDLGALTPRRAKRRCSRRQRAQRCDRQAAARRAARRSGARSRPVAADAARRAAAGGSAGVTRPFRYNELIGTQGGLTRAALRRAPGRGATPAQALVERRRRRQPAEPGDNDSPLLIATINGHFDLAQVPARARREPEPRQRRRRDAALRRAQRAVGAEGVLSAAARATCSSSTSLPRPDEGAARQGRRPQRAAANEGLVLAATTSTCSGVDEIGATPFWRAAYASDVEAMKLLVAHGADPNDPDDRSRPADDARRPGDAAGAIEDNVGHCRRCRSAALACRRCRPPPAPATAKASPPTRTASRRPACWPR